MTPDSMWALMLVLLAWGTGLLVGLFIRIARG